MTSRGTCEKCFKNRPLKRMNGPGLPEKGLEICRPCLQALKYVLKEKRK